MYSIFLPRKKPVHLLAATAIWFAAIPAYSADFAQRLALQMLSRLIVRKRAGKLIRMLASSVVPALISARSRAFHLVVQLKKLKLLLKTDHSPATRMYAYSADFVRRTVLLTP